MRSLVQVQDGPPPTESLRKEVIIDLLSRSVVTEKMRGGIAQLVERLLCKQDVIGSNPLGSTIFLRHDQTAPWVLSRPVGRRLLRKPFNIVQRDNQRCRRIPSGGCVVERPTATLSKSSTLTKCMFMPRKRPPALSRRAARHMNMRE